MYRYHKIKLVIWDLDETFWNGTLSEGTVSVPEQNLELIKSLTDNGIVNSICSKNDWESVKNVLEQYGIADFFVFPSVNWDAKGNRVMQIIKNMQLRAENVLFIDDNPTNRGEVEFFCEGIMTITPGEIETLFADASQDKKRDVQHIRLQQYKVLEKKHRESCGCITNEEFLIRSCIRLDIHHNCVDQIDRIHDLLLRSNQLNFTKKRISREELLQMMSDVKVSCGYITVTDRFGDYGVVGFYAMRDDVLIHFLFSCRTLGMGIEQYVYNYLNRPKISVVGEVISDLSKTQIPPWINQGGVQSNVKMAKLREGEPGKMLIKGPCDLYQIFPYIANRKKIDTDFTHTTATGVPIESTSHTTHVSEAYRLSKDQKNLVADEVPFVDIDIYNDAIYNKGYKVVVLSILSDANLGVYRRKETGEKFAFLEYNHPITDPDCWDGIISGKYYNAGFPFDKTMLEEFAEKYEFIGRNTPKRIVENLSYIRKRLPNDCLMIVMLGGELYYEKNNNEAYADRHLVHKEINACLRKWAESETNVKLLDVNKYLVDQSSFYDHFNHYTKPVYYALAGELVEMANEHTGSAIKKTTKLAMIKIRAKEMLAPLYNKAKKIFNKGMGK